MVTVFRGVGGNVCAMGCELLRWMWVSEEPMVYVGFSWYLCVNVLGGDVDEAYIFAELARWWVVRFLVFFMWRGLEVTPHEYGHVFVLVRYLLLYPC